MLVDVMLPFYGDMSLFQAAVRSVLAQTHTEFRLIMVDDQYPDPEPARWFQGLDDPRLQYLRNAENLGVNGNFRRCVDLAEAPAFTIMGCDDLMGPDHLARAVAALAGNADAAIVASGVEVIDASGALVRPLGDRVKSVLAPSAAITLRGEELAAGLYRGNWTYFPSLLWRRDIARPIGFREGLEVVLDLALLTDIARSGGSLVFDPEVTFSYRRHVASVSSVRAVDGSRFVEEREFFAAEARTCESLGWTTAAKAARRHPTSRLNAATLLPGALLGRQWPVAGELVRHLVR